jgi:hypothetical protein
MGDEDDEITGAEFDALLPTEVKNALAEESEYIASKVRASQGTWDKTLASGLTWLPWVGDIFEENKINTSAACSDVNRDDRVKLVVAKIEKALDSKLSEDEVDGIRSLIYELYNTSINLDDDL